MQTIDTSTKEFSGLVERLKSIPGDIRHSELKNLDWATRHALDAFEICPYCGDNKPPLLVCLRQAAGFVID